MTTTQKKTTTIKLKSLKEPREDSDGVRILIARSGFPYWLNVKTKRWDEWWKELAPSKSLWRDYVKDKRIDWPEYAKRKLCGLYSEYISIASRQNGGSWVKH